jgi:hypothetical protein
MHLPPAQAGKQTVLPHWDGGSVALICDAGGVTRHSFAVRSLALGSAGALLVAGCGGGGRLSQGDFAKRANAVCTAFRASTERIARPRTYADIVAYVKKTRPMYEAARLKLAALEPPVKDEPTVKRWLAADKRISDALGDLGDAALRHDFPAVTAAANRIQAEGVESRHAAQELGLSVCSQA